MNIRVKYNSPPITTTWFFLVDNRDFDPVLLEDAPNGRTWAYTYNGVERYRFIPKPYTKAGDKFYAGIDLTNLIATRP